MPSALPRSVRAGGAFNRPSDMKDDRKKRRRKPARDPQEIGVIRVFSKPGPDAEDRVRRLVSLMIKYATSDGQDTPEREPPTDDRPADDPAEAEA